MCFAQQRTHANRPRFLLCCKWPYSEQKWLFQWVRLFFFGIFRFLHAPHGNFPVLTRRTEQSAQTSYGRNEVKPGVPYWCQTSTAHNSHWSFCTVCWSEMPWRLRLLPLWKAFFVSDSREYVQLVFCFTQASRNDFPQGHLPTFILDRNANVQILDN